MIQNPEERCPHSKKAMRRDPSSQCMVDPAYVARYGSADVVEYNHQQERARPRLGIQRRSD
jgi:hypothetical protein